jgi:glycosyltransferase involved in cell wall biosynthesis
MLWHGANHRRDPKVLIADHRVPTWDRDSGGLRMRGMIEALIDLGCHVTFIPDNLMSLQPYTRELQRIGVEVLYGIDVESHLASTGDSLSLVVLSRPQVAGRWLELIRQHAPSATVAYDTVDLHWLREARRDRGCSGGAALSPKAAAMREFELALIRATDATIVVSERERGQVVRDVPEAVVHVVPNVNEIRAVVPPPHERCGVLFVGGFEHPPNVDAALTLICDVMPQVWREDGEVRVTIVGADPPPEVTALASPLVDVKGWVQDLEALLDSARALVAPLTYGAGLKGKVTQALAAGLPVVTTAIGAEGLDAIDGKHLLIGGTPEELAEHVIRIMRDGELWLRLSRSGQQLAADLCSPAVMAARLSLLLGEVCASRRRERAGSRPSALVSGIRP